MITDRFPAINAKYPSIIVVSEKKSTRIEVDMADRQKKGPRREEKKKKKKRAISNRVEWNQPN